MAYLFKFVDDYIRFIEFGRAISLIVIQEFFAQVDVFESYFLENVYFSHPLLMYLYLNL